MTIISIKNPGIKLSLKNGYSTETHFDSYIQDGSTRSVQRNSHAKTVTFDIKNVGQQTVKCKVIIRIMKGKKTWL